LSTEPERCSVDVAFFRGFFVGAEIGIGASAFALAFAVCSRLYLDKLKGSAISGF